MTTWLLGSYGADMEGSGPGIAVARSRDDGTLEIVGVADPTPDPAFLVQHGDHVYAAIEGPDEGFVQSWRREGETLTLDGRASSGGQYPCSLAIAGDMLVVANYGEGTVGVVGLDAAGAVTELMQTLPGTGPTPGPHPDQGNSRAHAVYVTDDGAVLTLDLGTDEILVHRMQCAADEPARLERTGAFGLPAGTGPRDIVRHPSGLLLVVGELDGTMHALRWDGAGLELVASVQLPHEARVHAAGIALSDDGRFAYTSLRRSNLLATVAVDAVAPALTLVGAVPCGGDWGRHLAVDGPWLHVANQLSNEVTTFRLGDDGLPVQVAPGTPTGSPTFLLPID